jgi:23S rRNA pseudouridine2605 synthase
LTAPTDGERLQKILARAGIGSRRACEELIAAGRVTVGGEVAVLGRRVDPEHDRIELDGVPVVTRPGLVYYLLNKPVRVVSTADDPEGRPTVVGLVPSEPRVFPVGRLDWETEGLLVLTNDGELTQRLTHPSHGVEKEYLAEVDGVPTRGELRRLREGVDLDDGPTAPADVQLVQERDASAAIAIVIHEGRNRQVRRMCDAIGHPVQRLVRTRIGPVTDRQLAPGAWRELRAEEVRALYAAATPRTGEEEGGGAQGGAGNLRPT